MQHAATTLGAARRSWDKISPSPEGAAWENPARQRREAAGGTNRVRLADGSSFVRRRSRKLSMLETPPFSTTPLFNRHIAAPVVALNHQKISLPSAKELPVFANRCTRKSSATPCKQRFCG